MNTSLSRKPSVKSLIILLSILFLVCGCSLNISMDNPKSVEIAGAEAGETFQEYLWYQNPVVLMLHIALMLAGAIGVTALLPAPYEEETEQ
jgi:uncharacterized protein YceK